MTHHPLDVSTKPAYVKETIVDLRHRRQIERLLAVVS